MKRRSTFWKIFELPEVPSHVFLAGDVTAILGIENWRLQKFLSGKHYQLTSSGRPGKGQGTRRLFRLEDVYRIGIANFLVNDGFAPDFVSKVLEFIEDSDLISFDAEGRKRNSLIGFFRGVHGPDFRPISRSAQRPGNDAPYYLLDLDHITTEIDRKSREVLRK